MCNALHADQMGELLLNKIYHLFFTKAPLLFSIYLVKASWITGPISERHDVRDIYTSFRLVLFSRREGGARMNG